jgi:hypothetical protein
MSRAIHPGSAALAVAGAALAAMQASAEEAVLDAADACFAYSDALSTIGRAHEGPAAGWVAGRVYAEAEFCGGLPFAACERSEAPASCLSDLERHADAKADALLVAVPGSTPDALGRATGGIHDRMRVEMANGYPEFREECLETGGAAEECAARVAFLRWLQARSLARMAAEDRAP